MITSESAKFALSAVRLGNYCAIDSRLFLLGRGGKLDLMPLDLRKQLVAAADFEAVGKRASADVAVIGKAYFAAVVGGVGNHLDCDELTARGIEGKLHFGDVARSNQHVGRTIDCRVRSGAVVGDIAEFLRTIDEH